MPSATLTGDLISDAIRATGVDGDGRTAPDSSVGIYAARHNLLPNGDFEVDTRYWGVTLGTVARSATHPVSGTSCGMVVASGGGTLIVSQTAVIATPIPVVPFSYRFFVWAEGNLVGKSLTAFMFESGGASGGEITGAPSTTVRVLTAGRNEIRVTATPNKADRTTLDCRFQIPGLTSGDTFWIDKASCWQSPFPFLDAESSEPIPPSWVASPNQAPTFEAGIVGWTPTNVTATQDTLHVFPDGLTKSMKLVAGSGGSISTVFKTYFTGSPIARTRYAAAFHLYPDATTVGKTARVILGEAGGAQAYAAIQNVGRMLEANTFTEFIAQGIPAQADRTSIRVDVQINGAVAGDTMWVSGPQATDHYVVPTPATVSKATGTITIPMAVASPRKGWLSLSVRPAWSTASGAQSGRPSMPVTLADIPADSGTGSLSITFDGGNVVVTRSDGGGSDIAKAPWAPEVNVASVISATWDELGVYVSVEGRPLVGPFETIASDDFERADGLLNGSVTPVGGKTWLGSGQSLPRIVSGRYEPHASNLGNGYAYLDLGEVPARIRGTVSYIGGTGSGTHTIAMTDAMGSLIDLLHVYLGPLSTIYQWRENSGSFTSYRGGTFPDPILMDGTPAAVDLIVQGDTLAVSHNGEWFSFRHESVARLSSRSLFWEVNRLSGGLISRYHDVAADRYTQWAAPSMNIPARFDGIAYLGSKSDGSGHICGDILWAMTGNGSLSPTDIAALNAASPDPDAGTVGSSAKVKLVWPANTATTWGYQRPGASVSDRRASISGVARSV